MRVERLSEEFDLQFDVCAFDLRPGLPPEGLARERAYAGRAYPAGYLDNMRLMALESGIEMKRPALIPNTRKAHEATEFARDNGELPEFHRAVFKAYWTDEQNIGDAEVLCRIGAACGLDAAALGEALADRRYGARVKEQIDWARSAGISGVPTIIFEDRFAVVGAQDYEAFRDIARRVASGALKAEDSA